MTESILVVIIHHNNTQTQHQLGGVPSDSTINYVKSLLFTKIPSLQGKTHEEFSYKINDFALYPLHDSRTIKSIRNRRGLKGDLTLEVNVNDIPGHIEFQPQTSNGSATHETLPQLSNLDKPSPTTNPESISGSLSKSDKDFEKARASLHTPEQHPPAFATARSHTERVRKLLPLYRNQKKKQKKSSTHSSTSNPKKSSKSGLMGGSMIVFRKNSEAEDSHTSIESNESVQHSKAGTMILPDRKASMSPKERRNTSFQNDQGNNQGNHVKERKNTIQIDQRYNHVDVDPDIQKQRENREDKLRKIAMALVERRKRLDDRELELNNRESELKKLGKKYKKKEHDLQLREETIEQKEEEMQRREALLYEIDS